MIVLLLIETTSCAETYNEVSSFAFFTFDVDGASTCHNNLFANRESQTDTLFVVLLRLRDFTEVLEQLLLVLDRDAAA